MASGPELIPIAFEGSQALAFLDEVEARLARIAAQASNVIAASNSASNASGGGAASSAGSNQRAGTDGAFGGGVVGGIASALVGASNAFGAGYGKMSPYEVGAGIDGGMSSTNAAMRGAFSVAEYGADAIGKIPGAGILAGAAKAKIRAIESETFEPLQNAAGRLGAVAGQLGRAGVNISDKDLQIGSDLLIKQERQAYEAKKRAVQAVYSNGHVMDSFTFAWNHS